MRLLLLHFFFFFSHKLRENLRLGLESCENENFRSSSSSFTQISRGNESTRSTVGYQALRLIFSLIKVSSAYRNYS